MVLHSEWLDTCQLFQTLVGNCLLQINEYSERQYSHKIYLVRSFVVLVLPLQTITRYCQYEQVIKITIFQTGLSPSDHQKSGDELTTVHVTKLKLNVSSAQAHSSYYDNLPGFVTSAQGLSPLQGDTGQDSQDSQWPSSAKLGKLWLALQVCQF